MRLRPNGRAFYNAAEFSQRTKLWHWDLRGNEGKPHLVPRDDDRGCSIFLAIPFKVNSQRMVPLVSGKEGTERFNLSELYILHE